MGSPEVLADPRQIQVLAKERAGIEDIVTKYTDYKATVKSLEDTQAMLE